MSKLLITGVYGQLGRAVERAARERGLAAEGRDLDTLDINDRAAVVGWIEEHQPASVINCAAFTAVDDCETHEKEALAANGTAVGYLAEACNRVGARLVHVSTDYVFSGDASTPYLEDDPVAPASAYGRTKLVGEEQAKSARDHLIVRTAWLYGLGGGNFVEAIRRQVLGGNTNLRVVHDQAGCPTFCDDLAEAMLDLLATATGGIVHAVNSGITTWHGFATEIVRLMGAEVEVVPVATDEFPRPAPRPAYSVLSTDRLEQALDRTMPSWQDALRRYMENT